MSKFDGLTAANMTGAREIRVITLTEEEIFQRAREGFVFAHPKAPVFVRKLVRSGRLDWFLASARQAIRDIEKPVDLLTHEARAAWVLNTHARLLQSMDKATREAVAQIAVTAVRVGTKDMASPPHAIINAPCALGWVVAAGLALFGLGAAFF